MIVAVRVNWGTPFRPHRKSGGSFAGYVRGLQCRECRKEYPPIQLAICESCFGPLEVRYEIDAVRGAFHRGSFGGRPPTLWRYRELLPVSDDRGIVDLAAGYTPLRRARNLEDAIGSRELWIKDDTVNPTYSFKDRPVAVAMARLPCYVFAPASLEPAKLRLPQLYGGIVVPIDGTYDDANRVAFQVADRRGWGFVNINLRPYYAEGSKTLLFETWEQLGFDLPDVIVAPLGSGLLLTSLEKGRRELSELGEARERPPRLVGTQPAGCAPIVRGFESADGRPKPVRKPDTIVESLAIGDPGSG